MKRVVRFSDSDKRAVKKLNDWLAENPEVELIDIKLVVTGRGTEIVYAIVDIQTKNLKEESK